MTEVCYLVHHPTPSQQTQLPQAFFPQAFFPKLFFPKLPQAHTMDFGAEHRFEAQTQPKRLVGMEQAHQCPPLLDVVQLDPLCCA